MLKTTTTSVASGNITPAVDGPNKDMKEVYILAGLVLFLAVLLGAFWFYSQADHATPKTESSETLNTAQVSAVLSQPNSAASSQAVATVAPPSVGAAQPTTPDVIHAEIYFEVGRKGLTDEGKAIVAAHADMLKQNQDFGILIQGYTDQQGSVSYNKQLGLKRAETVKTELLTAGVAEHRMKVVSLGEEGVLCVDNSDACRHMNRRVHLEIRKIGQEHMTPPAVNLTQPERQPIEETPITEPVPVIDSPMESAPTPESASSVPSES
jgi:peptidoglycan-associated lipoprotein